MDIQSFQILQQAGEIATSYSPKGYVMDKIIIICAGGVQRVNLPHDVKMLVHYRLRLSLFDFSLLVENITAELINHGIVIQVTDDDVVYYKANRSIDIQAVRESIRVNDTIPKPLPIRKDKRLPLIRYQPDSRPEGWVKHNSDDICYYDADREREYVDPEGKYSQRDMELNYPSLGEYI